MATKPKKKGKKMFKELGTLASESKEIKRQIREAVQSKVAPALKSALVELIASVPSLTAVRWSQYTPYFNDGEECTFRVNDPEFQFDDGDFLSDWNLDEQADLNKSQLACIEKFSTQLGGIEDLLKEAFSDHTEITLTSTGLETDEYEHD